MERVKGKEIFCLFSRELKIKAFCNHSKDTIYIFNNQRTDCDLKLVKIEDKMI